jgi:biopolymer transport protein ExbD
VKKREAEIDIIPMVDIVFLLIIFFLVATQVKENELQAQINLPSTRHGARLVDEGGETLIVNVLSQEVDEERPYRVSGRNYSLEEFRRLLLERKRIVDQFKQEMPLVRIRGDRDSQFEEIQRALIACRDVGIWQVRLNAMKESVSLDEAQP